MAPVIAQMSPASQGEGQLLKHPLNKLIRITENVRYRFEIRSEVGNGHRDRDQKRQG
jgi:hypothetical protein